MSQPYVAASRGRAFRAIVLVSAGLRLALWTVWGDAPLTIHDERDYKTLALNLVEHGEFAFTPGQPISLRPPLYPAFVAGIYRVAGVGNDRAVRLVQVVLAMVLVWLTYRLAFMVVGLRAAAWAAGFLALYPSFLIYPNLILTEVLFTTLFVGTCTALAAAYRRDSTAMLGIAGFLLGLSALTRSVLWMIPPVLGLYLLATWPGTPRRRLLAMVAVCLGFAVPVAPWAWRNTTLQKTFTVIDVMGGRNFMMGNYEYTPLNRAWATIELTGERSWINVLRAHRPEAFVIQPTQGQVDKLAMREAISFVASHPALSLKRACVKFFNFWGLERELIAAAAQSSFGAMSTAALVGMTALIFGSYATVILGAVFGACLSTTCDRRVTGALVLFVVWICALHTLAFGHSRYHLPLIPLLGIFAAAAWIDLGALWARRHSAWFRLACVAAVLLMMFWASEVVLVDFDRFARALTRAA